MNALRTFGSWYWARVKEIPLIVSVFALGCITEALMITVPQLAFMVLGR